MTTIFLGPINNERREEKRLRFIAGATELLTIIGVN